MSRAGISATTSTSDTFLLVSARLSTLQGQQRELTSTRMDSDSFAAIASFHQGAHSACHSTVLSLSDPSPLLKLYAARSLIALHRPSEAVALIRGLNEPAAQAIALLAEYAASPAPNKAGISEKAEALADEIADDEGDGVDATLRVTVSTLLHLCDNTALAIFLLKQGASVKSLESVALLIYLYLSPSIRRPDLARSLYLNAKAWADDAILLQVCEAWIGAVTGSAAGTNGKEPGGYQSAYYVFDELAQLPGGSANVTALNGKAATQAAMGHWDEAQGNVGEASQIAGEDQDTLANQIVLNGHLGTPAAAVPLLQLLQKSGPTHPLIQNMVAQSALFDEAASKFVAAKA